MADYTFQGYRREPCGVAELRVSVTCGESDTTSGLAANPTVGNLIDKLGPLGATTCFGETSELTRAEQVSASRAKTPEVANKLRWSSLSRPVISPRASPPRATSRAG
jgi:(2R)-sulfolactate sulfo-lyase subunit beta